MRNAQRFDFTEGFDTYRVPDALPQVPLSFTYQGLSLEVLALLDTGASVNVLPHSVGIQLDAVWEEQTTSVMLASVQARGLLVSGKIREFQSWIFVRG